MPFHSLETAIAPYKNPNAVTLFHCLFRLDIFFSTLYEQANTFAKVLERA